MPVDDGAAVGGEGKHRGQSSRSNYSADLMKRNRDLEERLQKRTQALLKSSSSNAETAVCSSTQSQSSHTFQPKASLPSHDHHNDGRQQQQKQLSPSLHRQPVSQRRIRGNEDYLSPSSTSSASSSSSLASGNSTSALMTDEDDVSQANSGRADVSTRPRPSLQDTEHRIQVAQDLSDVSCSEMDDGDATSKDEWDSSTADTPHQVDLKRLMHLERSQHHQQQPPRRTPLYLLGPYTSGTDDDESEKQNTAIYDFYEQTQQSKQVNMMPPADMWSTYGTKHSPINASLPDYNGNRKLIRKIAAERSTPRTATSDARSSSISKTTSTLASKSRGRDSNHSRRDRSSSRTTRSTMSVDQNSSHHKSSSQRERLSSQSVPATTGSSDRGSSNHSRSQRESNHSRTRREQRHELSSCRSEAGSKGSTSLPPLLSRASPVRTTVPADKERHTHRDGASVPYYDPDLELAVQHALKKARAAQQLQKQKLLQEQEQKQELLLQQQQQQRQQKLLQNQQPQTHSPPSIQRRHPKPEEDLTSRDNNEEDSDDDDDVDSLGKVEEHDSKRMFSAAMDTDQTTITPFSTADGQVTKVRWTLFFGLTVCMLMLVVILVLALAAMTSILIIGNSKGNHAPTQAPSLLNGTGSSASATLSAISNGTEYPVPLPASPPTQAPMKRAAPVASPVPYPSQTSVNPTLVVFGGPVSRTTIHPTPSNYVPPDPPSQKSPTYSPSALPSSSPSKQPSASHSLRPVKLRELLSPTPSPIFQKTPAPSFIATAIVLSVTPLKPVIPTKTNHRKAAVGHGK